MIFLRNYTNTYYGFSYEYQYGEEGLPVKIFITFDQPISQGKLKEMLEIINRSFWERDITIFRITTHS